MSYSIQSRFTASIIANVLRSGLSFLTGILLARLLGPEQYGRMVFLLASFAAVRLFLDLGSSSAFFTLLSQKSRSQQFVRAFWCWIGFQFAFAISLLLILLPNSVILSLWGNESRLVLVLAFAASFVQGSVWTQASQMAEASRETVNVQRLSTLIVLMHLAVVCLLGWIGSLAVPFVFAALVAEWSAGSWFAARMYRTELNSDTEPQDPAQVKGEFHAFFRYCWPLVPLSVLSFAHDFADRWMLQNWGGAVQQAYFGVAQQFAAAALLATSSILRIFWKEIAEATHQGDLKRAKYLYQRISRMLYFIGASITGLVLPWSEHILRMTVGAAYVDGVTTMMLMLLYPVHQSMGQIGGTFLLATGQVRAQVALGAGYMIASLLAGYVVLAPTDAAIPGFGLASQGLAWKMVTLQIVGVNATAWVISRRFGWSFDWGYQLIGLGGCVAIGAIGYYLVTAVIFAGSSLFVQVPIAMTIYGSLLFIMVYAVPSSAGLTRSDITNGLQHILAMKVR